MDLETRCDSRAKGEGREDSRSRQQTRDRTEQADSITAPNFEPASM